MHRKLAFCSLLGVAMLGAATAFVGCTSILGDFEVAANAEGGTGKKNGDPCASGTECASTFCTDGVCCESACSGVCETCGVDKGKCTAVPDGTDPDKECKPEERPDSGGVAEPDAGSPITDGGPLEGGALDDGSTGLVNVPDGGFTQNEAPCVGSCNGARACKFPDKTTTCGTKFCNTSTQAGRFACDGKGHCDLDLEACSSFTCENDECRKTCAEQNDCQATHFCNISGVCQEKLANGLGCGNPDQCKSGFCVVEGGSGVCCNSECDASFGAGATCKKAGSVGKCQCSLNCGAGSCRLYYRDSDLDTFGDKDGTIAAGTAALGCDNAAPPAGFVASKTDCDDGDNRAKPGQTGWFADTTLGKGLRDFNCSGAIEKEIPEYPGSSCRFCYETKGEACEAENVCRAKGDQSRLSCALYKDVFCFPPGASCYSCGYSRFASNTYGFVANVDCGNSATPRSCGECSATGGGPPLIFNQPVQQRCH
jgi:hypothetical protein